MSLARQRWGEAFACQDNDFLHAVATLPLVGAVPPYRPKKWKRRFKWWFKDKWLHILDHLKQVDRPPPVRDHDLSLAHPNWREQAPSHLQAQLGMPPGAEPVSGAAQLKKHQAGEKEKQPIIQTLSPR